MSEVELNQTPKPAAARGRGQEICVWVVPPFSGKVKKLRLKVWMVLGCVFLTFLFFSGVGVLAGDYVRVQFLRARNYIFLKSVSKERDNLRTKARKLEGELEQFKTDADRVASYERNVRQRLEELSAVIGSMKSMGVLGKDQNALIMRPGAKASFSNDGVGGAEVECDKGMLTCSSLTLEEGYPGEAFAETVFRPFERLSGYLRGSTTEKLVMEGEVEDNLIPMLDSYIETLKVVPFGVPVHNNTKVSSDFGYRRSPFSKSWSLHEGIDFSMPQGSHVITTGEGLVKEVRWHPTYGLVVDIEHNPSVVTRYAHLQKAFVSEGERVCRGDTIALVGTTGRSTGPHLHYEVRIDGQPKNPEELISLGEKLSNLL